MTARGQLLDAATATLTAAGVGSPRVDAELLLAHVLGVERSALPTIDGVGADDAARFGDLVRRRAQREPLQYLTGQAPFRYTMLAVGPGVFIPRPETELLVDAVLPSLTALDAPLVVDLCAGSGALAHSVAHEVPQATVIAVEQSPDALVWLRRNSAASSVEVVAADVRDAGLLADHDSAVDAVLCNPPYVPAGSAVGAEVAHDPSVAVFAGADGLALMPAVIDLAARLLRPGGVLALEHDDSQYESVPRLLRAGEQWCDVVDHRDLTGRPRYVTATRARTPPTHA